MASLFGGTVKIKHNQARISKTWRGLFYWELRAKKAAVVIRELHPWLRDKREQAEIALAIREYQTSRRYGRRTRSSFERRRVEELANTLRLVKRHDFVKSA